MSNIHDLQLTQAHLTEAETAAFMKALENPETREKIIQLLEAAGLLP